MYYLRRTTLIILGILLSSFAGRAEDAVPAPTETVPAAEAAPPAEPEAAAPAAEAPAAAPAAEASVPGGSHAVQKGDTLWDLAAKYYSDPYKWGRIWDANRDLIRNPNLIYPDQTVQIPGADGAPSAPAAAEAPAETAPADSAPAAEAPAAAEETAVAEAPASSTEAVPSPAEAPAEVTEAPAEAPVEAPAEAVAPAEAAPPAVEAPAAEPAPVPKKKPGARYVATDLGSDNFIVDENWEADGYILRDEQKKLMIAQDDVVYLNIGASNGAKAYMRGGIYRRGGKIKDPDTHKKLGFIMRRIGTFQLTENVGDQASTAVVTSSKEPIHLGDIIRLESN